MVISDIFALPLTLTVFFVIALKFYPLMCQQQSRLNCNRRTYTTYTSDTPGVPGSGDQEGWAPQDTCYARPPCQDWETQQIYLIHRNTHREEPNMRRQRNVTNKHTVQNFRKRTKIFLKTHTFKWCTLSRERFPFRSFLFIDCKMSRTRAI